MPRSLTARFALLALVAALGCGAPKLDSANLHKSIARVRKSVEARRRIDFDGAMKTVASASRGEIDGTKPFALDGMTADAIFAEAEKISLRRDLVWVERSLAEERQVLDARADLDRLLVRGFAARRDTDGQVLGSFEVVNGLQSAVDTAWLRVDAPRPGGGTLGGEDLIDFRPPLRPGERRNVQFQVTSEANRVLAEDPSTTVSTHFTSIGFGGNTLYQEPSPEALEKARQHLAAEERHRDELRAKLRG